MQEDGGAARTKGNRFRGSDAGCPWCTIRRQGLQVKENVQPSGVDWIFVTVPPFAHSKLTTETMSAIEQERALVAARAG